MTNNTKKYAVIVAGGKGVRMGSLIPKQFLPFLGKPLLCHPIQVFAQAIPGIQLILALPTEHIKSAQTVLRSYLSGIDVTVVPGGETRFHSVQNGLQEVKDDGVVFVHDGARPLVSESLILRCYKQALEKGSAVPAIPINESMRFIEDDNSRPVNRDLLRIVQTPQTFKTEILLPAFKQEYQPSFTDEATVVEAMGTRIHLVDGMRDNIKITTMEDMTIAEELYKSR